MHACAHTLSNDGSEIVRALNDMHVRAYTVLAFFATHGAKCGENDDLYERNLCRFNGICKENHHYCRATTATTTTTTT